MATTVQVNEDLRKTLEKLKLYKKESLNDVIVRLVKMSVDTEPLSKKEIEDIRESLKDIEEGRVYKLEDVKKELGL